MNTQPTSLARHVQPEVTEARLARQWSAIEAGRPRAFVIPSFVWKLSVVAALVIAVLVGRRWNSHVASNGLEGVAFESNTQGGSNAILRDGTRLHLDPGARLEVTTERPDRLDLLLVRGGVELTVVHSTARAVHVRAAGIDVVDVGTTFRVEIMPPNDTVRVAVSVGSVEVHRIGINSVLTALHGGESWSSMTAPAVATVVPPIPQPTAPPLGETPSQLAPTNNAITIPIARAPVASINSLESFEALAHSDRPREAYETLGAIGFARAVEIARPPRLLELADVAKLSSHPHDAAHAFDVLRRRFRSDPRAPLAAYQLGRLRLDVLLDSHGAEEAFADAIALSPTSPFREDAENRRIEALSSLGDNARCVAARDAYLSRYPDGVHSSTVAHRCLGR